MSGTPPSPGTFGDLTDKEVEVLRLLAVGHTVKSIAAQLARSEASINERLRDARRKTGIGSSRELARLLNAQKSWDKNPELSVRPDSIDEGMPPAKVGRPLSKGVRLMLVALPLATVALVLTGVNAVHNTSTSQVAHATAAGPSPLVGRWALDTSRIPAEERPGGVTISFRVGPDARWTTVVDIVAPDGSTRRAESTAATDGVPVPVTGNMDVINTGALRQPAPGTLVMTLGKDGAPISTRVYTVAKDGKTMTETIVWASGGLPKLETTYFKRVN